MTQVTYSAGESAGTVVSFYAGQNYYFQRRFGIGRERYRLSCRVVTKSLFWPSTGWSIFRPWPGSDHCCARLWEAVLCSCGNLNFFFLSVVPFSSLLVDNKLACNKPCPTWFPEASICILSAWLGCLCCDDLALSGHPLPAVVVQQVKVRVHHAQKGWLRDCAINDIKISEETKDSVKWSILEHQASQLQRVFQSSLEPNSCGF